MQEIVPYGKEITVALQKLNLKCANCDANLDSKRKIFCTDLCKERANLVRFVRRYGWDLVNGPDSEISNAFKDKLRFAVSSEHGYKANHKVSPSVRATVLNRDEGKCVMCGSDLNLEVDHMISMADIAEFNNPENLQVLCKNCHQQKTNSNMIERPMTAEEIAIWKPLCARIDSLYPLRICDDHERWEYLRKMKNRKIVLRFLKNSDHLASPFNLIDELIAL